jgi:protein-disulfide isomerase
MLGIAGRAAILVALGLLALTGCSGSADSPGWQSLMTPTAGQTIDQVQASEAGGEPLPKIVNPKLSDLLAPGPLPEMMLGRTDAPVALIYFVSLTCPHCARFHAEGLPEIERRYIATGKVRLIIREFPIGKTSGAAAVANRCVPAKKYFPLLARFLAEQKSWVSQEVRRDVIFEAAKKEGLTRVEFDNCQANQSIVDGLKRIKDRGRQLGVVGTPTFFVDEVKLRTSPSLQEITAAIETALERRKVAGAPRQG